MGAVYQLASEDFSQWDAGTLAAFMDRWLQTWSANEIEQLRFVFRAVPIDLSGVMMRVRQVEANHSDGNVLRHLRQYSGMLARAGQQTLLTFEHYMVLPGLPAGDKADASANKLATGLGLRAQPIPDLPAILPTTYRVRSNMLAPVAGAYPLASVLVSYNMAGVWNWDTLASVLMIGFPVDVAVEIITHHGAAAFGKLDRAQTLLHGLTTQLGAKAALSKSTADYAMLLGAVQANEALHQVTFAVLVRGDTEKILREREQKVAAKLVGQAYVCRKDTKQQEHFKAFFTSAGKPEPPPNMRHNMTSSGITAVLGPLGLRRRDDTEGVCWGFSYQMPMFWDGFGPKLNEPNHGVFLGATGSGKTASCFAIAMREINLRGTQVIVMEPMGNCRRLVDAIGADRSSYNPLSLRSLRINPVDRLYDDLGEQSSHLGVMVGLLLGRKLDERELVALDQAARLVYDGVTSDTPPVNQPRLENLAMALCSLGGEDWLRNTGRDLGSLLEEWYVRGSRAGNFNVPTQADWRLEQDLIAFDFSGLPEDDEALLRQVYYLVLSAIQREAFRQARSRPRLVIVDEFRVMSTEPMLARRVAKMFKTFRTLGVGVWAMEQDAITFIGLDKLGAAGSQSDIDTTAGTYILSNSTFVVTLAHRRTGAEILPSVFPQLTPQHVNYLSSLKPKKNPGDKGRGLMIILTEDAVYPLKIEMTPHELALLGGS